MGTLRVLLVEDNADDEFLSRWVLNKAGIEHIAVASDGREALEMLYGADGAAGTLPDLMILDLQLPKLDGREVLRRVREDAVTEHLPVLVLTSSEDVGDKELCRQLGIVDFVSKPLKVDVLREIIGGIAV